MSQSDCCPPIAAGLSNWSKWGPLHRRSIHLALMLMLVTLWSVTHHYAGLTGDAELYAVQALARIHENLASDLYLKFTSQDRFTCFSPLYAALIHVLGLHAAALALTMIFKTWFYVASWALGRALWGTRTAYLCAAGLIILSSNYGAAGVFRYAEDWVTARSMAEAMVVTSLALDARNHRFFALAMAVAALTVHPLMALPGIIILVCLWLPVRTGVTLVIFGLLAIGAVGAAGLANAAHDGPLAIMDSDWLGVVRERSQFLFLQQWSAADWQMNARPFVSLLLSGLILQDHRVVRICSTAALVGAAGLAIAAIASAAPVAMLLQGQAWRWEWITCFLAALLVIPSVLSAWQDPRGGRLCAVLFLAGWLYAPIAPLPCLALSLILWLLRRRMTERIARWFQYAAIAVAVIVGVAIVSNAWTLAGSPPPESGRETASVTLLRNVLGIDGLALLPATAAVCLAARSRTALLPASLAAALSLAVILLLPSAMRDMVTDGTADQVRDYADWRATIPPTSNVFVATVRNAATFAWLTLDRPSYLTVDQSAGVVFSRETALEVVRRSEVLEPLMEPSYRILTGRHKAASVQPSTATADPARGPIVRPVTREILMRVCEDPQLSFVVATEDVGFEPLHHPSRANRKDWNLYDCRQVNAERPPA